MSQPLTLGMIEEYLQEDIPDIDSPSDIDIDDDIEEEARPTSPLNNFDFVFNNVQRTVSNVVDEPSDNFETETPVEYSNTGSLQPSTSQTTDVEEIHKKNKKQPEPNRKWKKVEAVTEIPDIPQSEDRLHSVFGGCSTSTDIFLKLIKPILEIIVYQSNLYATQRGKTLRLTENELLAFIGMNFVMGYHNVPYKHDYWSQAPDLHVSVIADPMPRDRFDEILSCLHVNDNHLIPNDCSDKLYKLRPMIERLNNSFFESYDGTRQVSVDKSIVLFKGRNSMKQYNPMKPIKRSYKLWCVADLKGYIFNFDIYQGKNEVLEKEFENFGLGERVVLSLTKTFWGSNRIVCFDNYFSSVALMEKLKTENTLACATIRASRRGLPDNMTADKYLNRGDYDYRVSNLGISFFKWRDNKAIHFISNYHGTEQTEVKRTQKDGSRKNIPCPIVVDDYNKFMGGVDQADRYRVLYGIDRKSRKW